MRKAIAPVLAILFLSQGCDRTSSPPSSEEANAAARPASSAGEPLVNPGLYEVTAVQSIPGQQTTMVAPAQLCITPGMAASTDKPFAVPYISGCTRSAPQRDGNEVRAELRCTDDRNVNFLGTYGGDDWDEVMMGSWPHGSYEWHSSGRRIGDC